jgi:outer membrane receptor protein involved in Fe transport
MNLCIAIVLALAAVVPGAAAQNGPPPAGGPPSAVQAQGGAIRGVVRDGAGGAPLAGAGVAVHAADGVLVAGTVTGADGTFRVAGVTPGAYTLRVNRIGHAAASVGVTVTPATRVADVGEVRLAAAAVALEGVTVTAERSPVTTAPDRTVYAGRALPGATGGNATDLLRGVPGVEVDLDGKVSLRGNPNVAIHLNGRLAPARGDALAAFLRQIPAGMVERVEVVPNPSAREDPDGLAGVLNLVLKQTPDLGTSGGFTLAAGTGDKYSASGNLGWQRGKATLFGTYGFNRELRGSDARAFRQNKYDDTFLETTTRGDYALASHTFTGQAEVRPTQRDAVTAAFTLGARSTEFDNTSHYTLRDASRAPMAGFQRRTVMDAGGVMGDGSLAFRRTWVPQRHDLSAEARLSRSRDDNATGFFALPGGAGLQRTDNDASSGETRLQVDHRRPLGAALLETGVSSVFRGLDSDYRDLRFAGGEPTAPADRFSYRGRVHAGYAQLARDAGALSLQGGLRLERSSTTFRDDWTLFPSASAAWRVGGATELRASYSRRIQRPDPRLLNPFPFQEDSLSRFQGNPGLRPELTQSFELGLRRSVSWGMLQFTPFYRHSDDVVRRFRRVDPGGVATLTFENLASSRSYGVDANVSLKPGGRVGGLLSLSAYQLETEGSNVQAGLRGSALAWSARASVTYQLSPRTEVQWFQLYRAPTRIEQGRLSGLSLANVSLRHKVAGDRGALTFRLSDPFDSMRFEQSTDDAVLYQVLERKMASRVAYVGFQYNVGRAPRLSPRPQPQPAPSPIPGAELPVP